MSLPNTGGREEKIICEFNSFNHYPKALESLLIALSALPLDALELGATPLGLFPPLLLQCLLPLLSPPPLSSALSESRFISFSVLLQGQLKSTVVPPVVGQVGQFRYSHSSVWLGICLV